MGPGGWIVLALIAVFVGFIVWKEWPPRTRSKSSDLFAAAGLPKAAVILEKAPEIVESQAPLWQVELGRKLESQGWRLVGDYSYSASQFFWARLYLFPDAKSVLLFVNWVEGINQGRQITTNLELYSFQNDGPFLVTAVAQDGAVRLLTGANRPSEDRLSLHLKAVFAESSVKPILEEHQKRVAEWEAKGKTFRELNPSNVLASLSKIFS